MRNSTERTEGTRRLGGTQGQDIVKPLDTGKPRDDASKMITCYKCHKQGHMSRECTQARGNIKEARPLRVEVKVGSRNGRNSTKVDLG